MDFIFRRYAPSDKNKLEDKLISKKYFNKYISKPIKYKIASLLGIYKNYLYVLERKADNKIIGAILLRRRINQYLHHIDWWIYGVFISSEFRGKGLGKKLIKFALEELKRRKAPKVFLYVAANNEIAICLYKRIGFGPVEKIHTIDKNNKGYLIHTFNDQSKNHSFEVIEIKSDKYKSTFNEILIINETPTDIVRKIFIKLFSLFSIYKLIIHKCSFKNKLCFVAIIFYLRNRARVEFFISDRLENEEVESLILYYNSKYSEINSLKFVFRYKLTNNSKEYYSDELNHFSTSQILMCYDIRQEGVKY